MNSVSTAQQERTFRLASTFLEETRRDLERAAAQGADIPPRLRTVHARAGHATPEYRTLAIPIPEGTADPSPAVLSDVIARYAATSLPLCLLLSLDVVMNGADGGVRRMLIAEARDRSGTRLFLTQGFRVEETKLVWEEPDEGGWRDPGEEEMVLDAAFSSSPLAGAAPGS